MAKIGLCFSHLLSQGDTTRKAGVQEKKHKKKVQGAHSQRVCAAPVKTLRPESREDAEHTENTQTEKNRNRIVIGRILIGRRRTLPLCHYQQPVHRGHTSAGDIAVALPCPAAGAPLLSRSTCVQSPGATHLPLEWNFSRSREFLGYITPVTKATTTPSLPPISG